MQHRSDAGETRGPRRLFLVPGTERTSIELLPGEMEHAVRVLRLGPGDRVTGLDGYGGSWPLTVESIEKRAMTLARAGEPVLEAAAGTAGAPLPWIECAVALPQSSRTEEMVDRLTQLGVSAIAPIAWRRSTPQAQSDGEHRRERLSRIVRAACKQCGRAWLPIVRPLRTLDALLDDDRRAELVVLSPRAESRLSDWIRARSMAARSSMPGTADALARNATDARREKREHSLDARSTEHEHATGNARASGRDGDARKAIEGLGAAKPAHASLSELGAESTNAPWPWTADRPVVLVIGPEGGFAAEEHAALVATGAHFASIAPFTLRVETAAEAALAVLVDLLHVHRSSPER